MFGWLKSLLPGGRKTAKRPARRPRPAAPPATPERAELIRNAMAVHRAKRKILDDLSDEDRAKLVALAITAFLDEGRPPPAAQNAGKKKVR